MTKTPESIQFIETKEDVLDNLEAMHILLQRVIDDGMIDNDAYYYNELLDLREEAALSKSLAELAEVISKAKTLETDIDAWLSAKGMTTLSLLWPNI